MLSELQKKKLNEDLDGGQVQTRKGSGGRELSYLAGWYVIDRLNQIMGPGGWSYDCQPTLVVSSRVVGKDGKERCSVSYNAKCVLEGPGFKIGDWGTGHGLDPDEGQAHESALKEACTDAIKRCAKSLGRSMGLALYDKAQVHVETAWQAAVRAAVEALASASTPDEMRRAKDLAKNAWPIATKVGKEELTLAVKVADERMAAGKVKSDE